MAKIDSLTEDELSEIRAFLQLMRSNQTLYGKLPPAVVRSLVLAERMYDILSEFKGVPKL